MPENPVVESQLLYRQNQETLECIVHKRKSGQNYLAILLVVSASKILSGYCLTSELET